MGVCGPRVPSLGGGGVVFVVVLDTMCFSGIPLHSLFLSGAESQGMEYVLSEQLLSSP